MLRPFLIVLPMLMVAACDDTPNAEGGNTSEPVVSIDRSDGGGGNVSLNIPGVSAKIRLPEALMESSGFDINGVKLFPGSKIVAMRIAAPNEDFRLTFDAPAVPAKVSLWFRQRFAEKSVAMTATGNDLAGTTTDGDAFTISIQPSANGHSTGVIMVDEKNL